MPLQLRDVVAHDEVADRLYAHLFDTWVALGFNNPPNTTYRHSRRRVRDIRRRSAHLQTELITTPKPLTRRYLDQYILWSQGH